MQIPMNNRLLACASLLRTGCRVADIGADHGYLSIYLVMSGIAQSVIASDLREKPIEKGRSNAVRFGVADRITFCCAPGLDAVPTTGIDTVICAGMGADTIIKILNNAPWVFARQYELVLQPQSSGQDLRRYLAEHGFSIDREILAKDGRFLYTALHAVYIGERTVLSPGEQFVSAALRREGGPLLEQYIGRISKAMEQTLDAMKRGNCAPEKFDYYRSALTEIREMTTNENSKRNM